MATTPVEYITLDEKLAMNPNLEKHSRGGRRVDSGLSMSGSSASVGTNSSRPAAGPNTGPASVSDIVPSVNPRDHTATQVTEESGKSPSPKFLSFGLASLALEKRKLKDKLAANGRRVSAARRTHDEPRGQPQNGTPQELPVENPANKTSEGTEKEQDAAEIARRVRVAKKQMDAVSVMASMMKRGRDKSYQGSNFQLVSEAVLEPEPADEPVPLERHPSPIPSERELVDEDEKMIEEELRILTPTKSPEPVIMEVLSEKATDETVSAQSSPCPVEMEPTPPPPEYQEISDVEDEPQEVASWRDFFIGYTQDTTLHGMRFTTASNGFTFRRLFWSCIICMAIGVFMFYLTDRVSEYLLFKKNVNVVMNYVTAIEFPAVTLCNENQFRLTAATQGGWYDLVETILALSSTSGGVYSCLDNQWRCNDGTCIISSKVCDAFGDCSAGEDEQGCDPCPLLLISSTNLSSSLAGHLYENIGAGADNTSQYSKISGYPNRYLYYSTAEDAWVLGSSTSSQPTAICVSPECSNQHIGDSQLTWLYNGNNITVNVMCHVHPEPDAMSMLATNPVTNLTLASMFDLGAHQISTFLESCTYKGEPCDMTTDFVNTYTDAGVCYTFYRPDATVEQSGPGYGLRMTINVEQYEYTKNPQTGVGIKILTHDIEDMPLMQERSFRVSPGLYSLVSLERTEIQNLGPPWGNCSSPQLTFYPTYSTSACKMDCENTLARELCRCRDIHMHSTGPDDDAVCNIDEYVDCLKPRIEVTRQAGNFCSCALPCTEKYYVPNLSFASISMDEDSTDPEQLETVARLSRSLSQAREVRFRISGEKYRDTVRKFHGMFRAFTRFSQSLADYKSSLGSEANSVLDLALMMKSDCIGMNSLQYELGRELRVTLLERVSKFATALYNMLYINLHEFQWTANQVLDNYYGNMTDMNMTDTNRTNREELEFLYGHNASMWLTLLGLQPAVEVFWEQYVTDLRDLISNANMTTSYLLSDDLISPLLDYSRVTCDWCVTSTTLDASHDYFCPWCSTYNTSLADIVTQSMEHFLNETFDEPYHTLSQQISSMAEFYQNGVVNLAYDWENYLNLTEYLMESSPDSNSSEATTAAQQPTTEEPPTQQPLIEPQSYAILVNETIDILQDILDSVGFLLNETEKNLREPLQVCSEFVVELQRLVSTKCASELDRYYNEYYDNHDQLSSVLQYTRDTLDIYNSTHSDYLDDYEQNAMNLRALVKADDSETMKTFLSGQLLSITGLLSERAIAASHVGNHFNNINYWFLAQFEESYLANSSAFWQYFQLQSPSVTCPASQLYGLGESCAVSDPSISAFWDAICNRVDAAKQTLDTKYADAIAAISDYEDYLSDFDDGNKIDETFYKKNYMQVDLFYKELVEKSVTQEKAYSYATLLGELGGLMGLLLGASVLTVIEFFDMVFYHALLKCLFRNQMRRNKKKLQEKERME